MSRIPPGTGDTVYVKPTNNIYTVLSAVAVIVVILGLLSVWMRSAELFGGLLSADPSPTSIRR